jgi:hypothetical protein
MRVFPLTDDFTCMPKDGIEIHFDEKRGYLEVACELDAFAAYRDIAREHLKDLPQIPIDQVMEIHVVDTATFVARRDAPKRRIGGLIVGFAITVILALALVGAFALIAKIFA